MNRHPAEAALESTCRKRVVVCELYDIHGKLIACESNRCDPPGGQCTRMGVVNGQADYPAESTCNWTHAEIMALQAVGSSNAPHRAVIYGHDFPCPRCEASLRAAGVVVIEVENRGLAGVGTR